MKKMATVLALLLVFCLVVPASAVEQAYNGKYTTSELPVTTEDITIRGFGARFELHGEWAEMPFFTGWSELTGVNVEWETAPQDGFGEKKNLMFAAGDFPDLMFRCYISHEDRINYGVDSDGSIGLLALNDLIDEYGANIQALYEAVPYAKVEATQYNGAIYDLPRVEESTNDRLHCVWINTAWLNNLDLSKPKTMDELLDVLRAFRDQDAHGNGDPSDEIPVGDWSSDFNRFIVTFCGNFGIGNMGSDMGYWNYNYETGTIDFNRNTENWRECLRFMNTLWTEKLIDPDLFTNDSARYRALMEEDRYGLEPSCNRTDVGSNWYKWDILLPIQAIEGVEPCYTQFRNPVLETGTVAISCTNPYPVETFKMIDFLYSDEGFKLQNFGGLEGVTYYIDDNGNYHTTNDDGSWVYETYAGIDMQYWGECTPYYGGSTPIWNKTNAYRQEMFPTEQLSAANYGTSAVRDFAHKLYTDNYIDEAMIEGQPNFTADETEELKAFTDDGYD